MELLAFLAIGVLSGQGASMLYNGYSLGALGNGLAGLTGAFFIGKYMTLLFGFSTYAGMFAGGLLGAIVILAVFSAAEALTRKNKRMF
jgi:uncharacterized membrane protein YeaQ/YmgE (transglycosylase-associated protein family)